MIRTMLKRWEEEKAMQNENKAEAVNEITPEEGKELAGLLGIQWHEFQNYNGIPVSRCSCGFTSNWRYELYEHESRANPNFFDPISTLEQAVKMEDWEKFSELIGVYDAVRGADCIDKKLMLNKTGLLAKRLFEWLRDHR
jgi:hypothetical protein